MAIELGPISIERDTLLEIVASVVPVALMIAALLVIGTEYSAGDTLSPSGGTAVVGTMVAFVIVMSAVGLWLTRVKGGDDE